MKLALGIDIGSISLNLALLEAEGRIAETVYLRTHGDVMHALNKGFKQLEGKEISAVGVTGSGRNFISAIVGADVAYDEITAHSAAVLSLYPKAKTIIEIGGQDSKFIQLEKGIVKDFNMNSVCAAGTGSFLDQQAARLNIKIEDFGDIAVTSKNPTKIAGRCTVFAESDMIHKQQAGYKQEDILAGLCESLCLNYMSSVALGRRMDEPIILQGGVAANKGIVKAFNKLLGAKVIIPEHFGCMGAVGAALLAMEKGIKETKFKGFDIARSDFKREIATCSGCSNRCELIHVYSMDINGNKKEKIATLGSVCGKYS